MPLFEDRVAYKPFEYPFGYEIFLKQNQMMWLPEEVPMADDIKDWNFKLSDAEKNLITNILRLFVQSDVEVSKSYGEIYLSRFKPIELKMGFAAIQNIEGVHMAAYAHLIDTLGLPESEYGAFLEYQEMREKYEAWQEYMNPESLEDLALSIVAFGAFTEGLQLFASFAMLLNFPRLNKLKGVGQIISWSVRDETMHCLFLIELFRKLLEEHPEVNTAALRERIEKACRDSVDHEDAFIDKAFEMGGVQGMNADDIKTYIRYIADRRLIQLGYKGIYNQRENPLEWLDDMLNAPEHANFFEQRATEYAKSATEGTWDEAYDDLYGAKDEWEVYSKSNCPYCVMAKRMLNQRGVEYVELNLDDEAERQKFYERTGARSVPQIYHKGKLVGGFQELQRYLNTL